MEMKDFEQLDKERKAEIARRDVRVSCMVRYLKTYCQDVLDKEPGLRQYVDEITTSTRRIEQLNEDCWNALMTEMDSVSFKEAPNG
jgi:hypothetical protein